MDCTMNECIYTGVCKALFGVHVNKGARLDCELIVEQTENDFDDASGTQKQIRL